MKRIVALLLAMVLTAALWAGGTAVYASVYTDTRADITVHFDGTNGATKNLIPSTTGWEPGRTEFENIKITSDAAYTWSLAFVQDASTLQTADLAEVLEVYWAYDHEIAGKTRTDALKIAHPVGTLAEILQGSKTIAGDAEGNATICIILKMSESAGNAYQNETESFQMTMTVSQKTSG